MWSMHQQETSSFGHAILEAGMPPFFLDWGKNLTYWKIPQLGSHRKQVDWSKTAEKQANTPNRKNYTKNDLEQN